NIYLIYFHLTAASYWLRQELCVNGKAHSVDQVKTLILMYHVFL
ncbi:hypothetical protein A5841_002663, partial [Enterococcus faecium]